jgi:hypothetical protein
LFREAATENSHRALFTKALDQFDRGQLDGRSSSYAEIDKIQISEQVRMSVIPRRIQPVSATPSNLTR